MVDMYIFLLITTIKQEKQFVRKQNENEIVVLVLGIS